MSDALEPSLKLLFAINSEIISPKRKRRVLRNIFENDYNSEGIKCLRK